jgi:hypothetical protein
MADNNNKRKLIAPKTEALKRQQSARQQCWMERFFKHYYTSMTIIGNVIQHIRPINEEPAAAATSSAASSATTTMQRQGSSAGHNSHRELYEHEPYGINTDQDIGMVLKLDGSNMNVIRYSYESRPRLVKPKLAEIAISALYSFYFKNRREIMDADCLMIISLNDANTNRVDNTALHQDGFVGHIAFKNNTYLPSNARNPPQINEVLMELLKNMRGDISSLPQYVIIVFKTVGTGSPDEKIIVTTIKSDGTYTFTTAPVAQGNTATQVIFDNDGLHGTPKPIDLELMKENFQTEFPDQLMDPQVIHLINEYNRYMIQAKQHIRHFTRRALNILDECRKILVLQAKQEVLKARMKAEAAITIIDGVINIRHPYVISKLAENLATNFSNWTEHINVGTHNLLQRLSNAIGSTPVNISEVEWPPNFFLIEPSLIPDGSGYRKRIEMTADEVEALTVYTEETVAYTRYTAEVQLMMSLKDRNEITRFDLPASSGCQGSKGGGSRSKTRSKTRQKRNTKKKRQNLRKRRRTNKRKQNKRRTKKRQ